jgi:hypothetical protein
VPELPVFFAIENTDQGLLGSNKKHRQISITYTKENVMIEITITEKAKIELFKVFRYFGAKSIRLIQQGFG